MKKIFVFLIVFCILLLTGCGKNTSESVFKDLTKKINNLNTYTLSGVLEVKNDNSNYNYDVVVDFKKDDKYKVSLRNISNSHEQVILRNDEGVYVITPSLNKSFKFQSDWPYNNSQIYILNSIINDLNNDSEIIKEKKDDKYVFISKVKYPNNNNLVKQRVIVNEDLAIEKIEILNNEDNVEMIFTINKIDYNPTFDETYFEVNNIINTNTNNLEIDKNNNMETNQDSNMTGNNKACPENENCDSDVNKTTSSMNGTENITPTATLQDIIYPLHLPTGTVLEDQEKISKTDGERVILTFAGEKNFTLVEETVLKEEDFTVIPTYGEPGFINDTVGALTDNSLNWISDGIEYYIVSDVMSTVELLDIANSINVSAVASLK